MATRADDKVHFDLEMSQAANRAIESIATFNKLSPSDVLSRAVALFIEVEKARKSSDGQTIGLLDAEKKPVVEFVGF